MRLLLILETESFKPVLNYQVLWQNSSLSLINSVLMTHSVLQINLQFYHSVTGTSKKEENL